MKKGVLLLCMMCFAFITQVQAQVVKSYEFVRTYTEDEMEGVLQDFIGGVSDNLPFPLETIIQLLAIDYAVDVYRVLYNTPHPVHGTIQASGLISVPQGLSGCGLATAIYQHGTTFSNTGVPSALSVEHNIGVILSASGYVSVMPDYIGLGDSEYMHPYVHAKSEATAGIDLLRATRELSEELDFMLNDQLFIYGYSQGGHGAMALFKEIETNHADEFTVTAAAPMSGPYNMSEIQAEVMWEEYSSPNYLPYVLMSYQSVYPELLSEFKVIFTEEFATLNDFQGDSEAFFTILRELNVPKVPSKMLLQSVLDDFKNDPDHPFRIALRDNDLYDWEPKADMYLMGCCDDEQVMFENTTFTYDHLKAKGIENVQMSDFCENFGQLGFLGHGGCVPFCLLFGKQFFDNRRTGSDCFVGLNDDKIKPLGIYPNPTRDVVNVISTAKNTNNAIVKISNVAGQVVKTYTQLVPNYNQFDLSDLNPGVYMLQMESADGHYAGKVVVYE